MGKGSSESRSSCLIPIVVALIGAIATVVVAVINNPSLIDTLTQMLQGGETICSNHSDLVALTQYWNPERDDNYTTTLWQGTGSRTTGAGVEYVFGRLEGYICPPG